MTRAVMMQRSKVFCFLFSAFCLLTIQPSNSAPTIEHDVIRLQSLNKATAQTRTFEMKIGETVKIGPLYIRPQACRTTPVTEEPESAGFLQIWTVNQGEEGIDAASEWVFSGWMFASSPGLSSMDHAVYDLWVVDCGEQVQEDLVPPAFLEASGDNLGAEDPQISAGGIVIEENDEMPIVKLDGEVLSVPEPEESDPRFQAYEAESAPIVHLE